MPTELHTWSVPVSHLLTTLLSGFFTGIRFSNLPFKLIQSIWDRDPGVSQRILIPPMISHLNKWKNPLQLTFLAKSPSPSDSLPSGHGRPVSLSFLLWIPGIIVRSQSIPIPHSPNPPRDPFIPFCHALCMAPFLCPLPDQSINQIGVRSVKNRHMWSVRLDLDLSHVCLMILFLFHF